MLRLWTQLKAMDSIVVGSNPACIVKFFYCINYGRKYLVNDLWWIFVDELFTFHFWCRIQVLSIWTTHGILKMQHMMLVGLARKSLALRTFSIDKFRFNCSYLNIKLYCYHRCHLRAGRGLCPPPSKEMINFAKIVKL